MRLLSPVTLLKSAMERIGLGPRIVLAAGLIGIAGTVGCITAVVQTVEADQAQRSQADLNANLVLLRTLAGASGREFRLDGDRLIAIRREANGTVSETPLNGRLDIVDEVKSALGGVATIFAGDLRIATNVTRPDGTRGVGTRLAQGVAYDAVLRRGETYRGVNEILGRQHLTIYEPIKDASGRVIGIWFVGLPIQELRATVDELTSRLVMLAGIAVVLAAPLMLLLVGWQLRPLKRIRADIERVAAGDLSVDDRLAIRQDEIGQMARAVVVFRDNAHKLAAAEAERVELARRADQSRAEIEARLVQAVGAVVDAARMGDFSVRAEASADLGRLAALVHGLNGLAEACEGFLDEADRALAQLADGDLSARMTENFDGRLAAVASNFNRATDALSTSLREVSRRAAETREVSGEIRNATENLSTRTESQAASLEETSAAVEEIAKTVSETASTVSVAAKNAEGNAARAAEGARVADEAIAAIDRVDAQAKKIVEIVGVMDGLAFQTNLLALNASVEAARAGDAGRGFAVVANEVRRLAQQSAEAARDVRNLITETNAHVESGVKLVRAAGDQLSAIAVATREVAQTFGEISRAAREQSSGVDEIARALSQMDEMTQQNAAAAEETAAAAATLAVNADELTDITARFKTEPSVAAGRRARAA